MNDHPDFEDLSAFADGEAPEWLDHVDSCLACRADVDRLRAVIAAVGQPVRPVAAEARARALSVALDALGPVAADSVRPPTDSALPAAPDEGDIDTHRVRPLRPPAAEAGPPIAAPPVPRWGVKGPWLALGSVAAVLLVVVLGATVLRSTGGGGDDTRTLASGAPDAAERASGLDQSASAGVGGITGSDLGPVDDAAQLQAKAGGELRRRSSAAEPPTGVDKATSDLAASESTAPTSGPGPASGSSSPRSPGVDGLAGTAVGTRPCEEQVRASRPQLGQVVYFASATSQGRPAHVLGFATGSAAPSAVTLLAVAQEGCGVLVEAALP